MLLLLLLLSTLAPLPLSLFRLSLTHPSPFSSLFFFRPLVSHIPFPLSCLVFVHRGRNGGGCLGLAAVADSVLQPVLCTPLQRERVVQIAAGKAHSMVLTVKGAVYSFGAGMFGRLVSSKRNETNRNENNTKERNFGGNSTNETNETKRKEEGVRKTKLTPLFPLSP